MAISSDRHRWTRVCLVVAVLVAVVAALLLTGAGGPAVTRAIAGWSLFTAAAGAGGVCLWRARALAGRMRWGWATIGAGLLSWGLGQFYWLCRYWLAAGETPVPSLADLGYLGMVFLVPAGLMTLPGSAQPLAHRVRGVLDGLMIAASLVVVAWDPLIQPLVRGDGDRLELFVTTAYPVGDVVMATMVAYQLARGRCRRRIDMALLGAGILAFAAADVSYAYLRLVSEYQVGHLGDLGWTVGLALMALGAAAPVPPRPAPPAERAVVRPGGLLLPYLVVLAAVACSSATYLANGHNSAVVIHARSVLILLIVGRQLLTLLENRVLTGTLEERVAARTAERMRLQEQLVHEAYHDALTQLPNRALFRDRVAAALGGDAVVTVLHVDLDGFKRINAGLGHVAGDELLILIGERLRGCLRAGDVVARFGADEFGVLIVAGPGDDAEAQAVARRILTDLETPVRLGERRIHVRASIGLARAGTGDDAEWLLRNADLAMHQAKTAGGGSLVDYHPRMRAGLVERLETESDLRAALEAGQLELYYQPTIDLDTSAVVGFEALVRWPHPTRGMINPLEFIPIAEATGLIVPLGEWVLREACRRAVEWSAAAGRPLKMSVNVSVRQLDQVELAETVAAVLAETGMPAEQLCLEMTESVLMTDTEANLEQLVRLKALGLTLAIDDFGTGYSSLAYLRRFPVDTLKIDRSFVERLGMLAGDTALTDTIVRLGRSLGMSTVAEGIEELGQLTALREMGCGFAQGYYFSRPVPADQAGRLFLEGADLSA